VQGLGAPLASCLPNDIIQFQAFSHDNNRQFLSPSRKRTQKGTGKNIDYKVSADKDLYELLEPLIKQIICFQMIQKIELT